MKPDGMINEYAAFARAQLASDELATPALALAESLDWQEAREIFRRVANRELTAGGFLTAFAESAARADLENFVLLLPTCYKLLAKYPTLLEQHRAKPALTTFPPEE
jgi:hypothetical protein